MGPIYSYLFILLNLAILAQGTCPWLQSGVQHWSQASTWPGGVVPGTGTNVTITPGMKVVYDVTTSGIVYAGITVNPGAQFIFDGTKNVILNTHYVNVEEGAFFYIGSSTCPYTTQASITLFGTYDNTSTVIPHSGIKNVIIQGQLEWWGTPPSPTWTNVAATVQVNATTITVKDTLTNWNVGDSIVIASTDYYAQLNERFTITAISGKTITLDRPATYMHWGGNNEYAEVGHLTRNIKVQGDISDGTSDGLGFGAHCITMYEGVSHVYGVEFSRSGQRGILARYPFHWHFMQDQIGKGNFVNESSFHDNYQRCVTVHATSGVAVQNNVAYNITGHCYFLEEGSETWNTYIHNLGIYTTPGPMIPTDAQASIFWITNPNNSFVDNVAVGGYGFGFWYSLPQNPIGLSMEFGYAQWMFPRLTPILRFDGNIAHSNQNNGIHQDTGPFPNGTTGSNDDTPLTPMAPPYSNTSNYNTNTPVRCVINGNQAYKNRNHGIWFRGNYITVAGSLLSDNQIGINMPTNQNLVLNTVIVGETPNYGTPNLLHCDDMGRSRPGMCNIDAVIMGWSGYDDGGNQYGINITFMNLTNNAVRRGGCLGADVGVNVLSPTNFLPESNCLPNNNAVALPTNPEATPHDNMKFFTQIDTDGTLTGLWGNAITTNNSFLTEVSTLFTCTEVPAWDMAANCSKNPDGYSQIQVFNANPSGTNFGNSLSEYFRATFTMFGHPSTATNVTGQDFDEPVRNTYVANMVSRHGVLLQFPHPTPPSLRVYLHDPFMGEWVVVAFQYPTGTTFTISRAGSGSVTPVTSVSQLTPYTYYFDSTNQYLYVMVYSNGASLSDPTGFPWSQDYSDTVSILASCGTSCIVSGSHPIPPALADTEDHYQASICGRGQGVAYFRFNRKLEWVTYTIYHNIPISENTTGAILVNGQVYQTLPVGQPPIRGGFPVSWLKSVALWNGNWSVVIDSVQYPGGAISGKLGCVGTCAGSGDISSANPCTPIKGEMLIYGDTINSTLGWKDVSRNVNETYGYTGSLRCGASSLYTEFRISGYLLFKITTGLNTAPYTYFQFDVMSPLGQLPNDFIATVSDTTGATIGTVDVNSTYVDNWIIEETWTRVKIPLSAFGLPPTGATIGYIGIRLPSQGADYQWPVIFDQIRLVPSYSDPLNMPPYGTVSPYVAAC